jgi:hypothetical protein
MLVQKQQHFCALVVKNPGEAERIVAMFPIWQMAEQYVSPEGAMPEWAECSQIVPVLVDIVEKP